MNVIILSVTLQQIVPIYPDLSSAPALGGWWAIPTQKGAKIPMNARPTETADPSLPVPGMEVAIGNVSTRVTGLNVAKMPTVRCRITNLSASVLTSTWATPAPPSGAPRLSARRTPTAAATRFARWPTTGVLTHAA